MRTSTIALLAGIGALSAVGSARASDIYTTSEYANPDLVQQVRMVCDDSGQCYRTRGGQRVIIQENIATPTILRTARALYTNAADTIRRLYNDGPSVGIGVRPA